MFDVGHFSESLVLTLFSAFVLCGSGRVLNRFSKDIGQMDVLLPITFVDACQVLFSNIALYTLRLSAPWSLKPVGIMLLNYAGQLLDSTALLSIFFWWIWWKMFNRCC